LAVVQSERYYGQETSFIQVLRETSIAFDEQAIKKPKIIDQAEQTLSEKSQKKMKLNWTLPSCLQNFHGTNRGLKET